MSRKWKKHGRPRLRAARPALPPIRALGMRPAILGEDGQTKLGTFEGVAYTGAPMRPQNWYQDVVIDLGGVELPSQHRPALRQHDHEQIVGHTTAVSVDQDGIKVRGVLSGQPEHVDKVRVPARNGFQWQLSVGADPIATEQLKEGEEMEVNGRTVTGPLLISRKTRLGEISFVPLGADGETSVAVAANRGLPMNPFALALKALMARLRSSGKIKAAKFSDEEIDKMSEDEAKAALKKAMAADAADGDGDEDEDEDEDDVEGEEDDVEGEGDEEEDEEERSESARRSGIRGNGKKKLRAGRRPRLSAARKFRLEMAREAAAETRRQSAIYAACKGYERATITVGGKTVGLIEHAIGAGWTVHRVKAELLDVVRAERPQGTIGVPGGLAYSTSPPSLNDAVLEAAMLHAMRHQLLLEDDAFYHDTAPDGRTQLRRVPKRVQDEVQRDFRARYSDQVQQTAHTLFKGRIGMHQVLAAGMQGMGYQGTLDLRSEQGMLSMLKAWHALDQRRAIQAEGSSNLNIANVLANVMNKFALQGYLFTEQSWREWVAIRPVNDFKATKSINLVSTAMFQKFGPSGELANFAVGDQAFSNQAEPYGGILTIPWPHLVNDDLGMLGQAPLLIGRAAGLALLDNLYTLLANMSTNGTVNGDDGVAFFRTGSLLTDAAKKNGKAYKANKMSGGTSALSSAALQTAKALYDNQVDPAGFPLGFDGMQPILMFGPSNWMTAMELLTYASIVYGGAAAARQPNGNVWAGLMKPVLSRYIENASYVNSTTAWFVLYNPVALPIVEACFLNGVDTPAVLQAGPDYQFDKPGISIRGTMPFGSNQQNFRGGVYSVGA